MTENRNFLSARVAAVCAVIGPVVFIAGWAILGTRIPHYSFTNDFISEIARSGRSTHSMMTIVFCVYGIAIDVWAIEIRKFSKVGGWIGLVVGTASIAVAAFPLGTHFRDQLHDIFAVLGYLSFAAIIAFMTPKLFCPCRRAVLIGSAIALAMFTCMLLSIVGPTKVDGLFQRLGLTIGDLWIVVTATRVLKHDKNSIADLAN